jgi:hypothetical protein
MPSSSSSCGWHLADSLAVGRSGGHNVRNRFLRTPGGQLTLLGIAFAGALLLAVVMATHRGFFEQYVREEYEPLPGELRELMGRLNGSDGLQEVKSLTPAQRTLLYGGWINRPENRPANAPAILVAADADYFLSRAEQTLVVGSREQRFSAVSFLEQSKNTEARRILLRARTRAEAGGDDEMADRIRDALARLPDP